MRTGMGFAVFLFLVGGVSLGLAQLVSPEVYQRHHENMVQIKQIMAGPDADGKKFQRMTEASLQESIADYRLEILALAADHPGAAQESFLIDRLRSDGDWVVRSEAARMLARFGSEAAISPLAKAAATDKVTIGMRGDVGGSGAARRAAIFALAELGRRLPKSAAAIADEVRKLPDVNETEGDVRESLGDARRQALFQLTQDRALLEPFLERLKSKDAKTRIDGVTAFQFLSLTKAPAELVALARDPSPEVKGWVMLVLGEIGDAKTVPMLMEMAKDASMDRGTRCNAIGSLGRMRATDAKLLMESLLSDESVKTNAAIALSEITGKRHPLVPEGYGGPDWPRESRK